MTTYAALYRQMSILHEKMNRILQIEEERPSIHSPNDMYNLVFMELDHLDHEELWIICLDTRNRVLQKKKLYAGSVNQSQVRVAEVLRPPLDLNAPAIIIIHNHPSGDPAPSPDDIVITRAIVQAAQLMDIQVLDHLVIGKGRYVSMKERGLGF